MKFSHPAKASSVPRSARLRALAFASVAATAAALLTGVPAQAAPTAPGPRSAPATPRSTTPDTDEAAAKQRAGTPLATASSRPPVHQRAAAGPSPTAWSVGGTLNGVRTNLAYVGQQSFDPKITDYALKCTQGSQQVEVSLSGANLTLDGASGSSLKRTLTLVEHQALTVQANNTTYWFRCLPRDFPDLKVTRNGEVRDGWYLVETNRPWIYPDYDTYNLPYAMITDTNGTPVWYMGFPPGYMNSQPVNPTVMTWLPRIAGVGWEPNLKYIRYDLTTQTLSEFGPTVPNVYLDPHEMLLQRNGKWGWLSTPPMDLGNLSAYPGSRGNTSIFDCRIQEVDEAGNASFEWRAFSNVKAGYDSIGLESSQPRPDASVPWEGRWDAYHCNSLDQDENGDYLLSMRSTSSVFKVRGGKSKTGAPGTIAWEIRGADSYLKAPAGAPGARNNTWPILTVVGADGKPVTGNKFNGQHDARFTARGISIFNNNAPGPNPSRTMEFQVDEAARTAKIVWDLPTGQTFPDNNKQVKSTHMGSFQRREATGENVIGYGAIPGSGVAEVDNDKQLKRRIVPGNEGGYRARKYAPETFDRAILREAAGRPIVTCNAPMLDREQQLGGVLGRRASELLIGLPNDGCQREYQNATSLVWSKQTGAFFTRGAIRDRYAQLGGPGREMGYPISDEFCGLRDGGCAQRFTGGLIYWSPTTGSQPVYGAIGDKYASLWWENSALGYPVGAEQCWIVGGCFQQFQGGSIYWSPGTGAHTVWGAIFDKWGDLRWEAGMMRYPTSDEMCGLRDGGCWQSFTGGAIYWSPASGAHNNVGLIREEYGRQNWEHGRLRYPTSDERCGQPGGGCIQDYQGGTITWSPSRGVSTRFR